MAVYFDLILVEMFTPLISVTKWKSTNYNHTNVRDHLDENYGIALCKKLTPWSVCPTAILILP